MFRQGQLVNLVCGDIKTVTVVTRATPKLVRVRDSPYPFNHTGAISKRGLNLQNVKPYKIEPF